MDDFARGELLWVRRELNSSDSCGLCFLIEEGLTEFSKSQLSHSYIECFSELFALWDNTVLEPGWKQEHGYNLITGTPRTIKCIDTHRTVKCTDKPHHCLWWPLDSYGNKLRIRAIDFLLTGRQGAIYTSYKPQGETK